MEYLIIDGYNVMNAWRDIIDIDASGLEECREKLLTIISNFQGYKNSNVIVVFDAHLVKNSREKKEKFDNVTVVFTKENETADNYIERFVHRNGTTNVIRVVTSDYLEQTMILSNGGIRVSPRELRAEVHASASSKMPTKAQRPRASNSIMNNLNPDLLEKLEKMRRTNK